jgi:hypothetical protein
MIAEQAASRIRQYWSRYRDAHKYEKVDVRIRPVTFEVYSNMVNGYPPAKE